MLKQKEHKANQKNYKGKPQKDLYLFPTLDYNFNWNSISYIKEYHKSSGI